MSTGLAKTIGEVIGENAKRLREERGWTQEQAGWELEQNQQLGWTTALLASLESGRRQDLRVSELLQLAEGYEVPISELFAGEGEVSYSTSRSGLRNEIRSIFMGRTPTSYLKDEAGEVQVSRCFFTLVDGEYARRKNVPIDLVLKTANQLWGHSLSEEREQQFEKLESSKEGRGAHAKRGHISRRLITQLEAALQKELNE